MKIRTKIFFVLTLVSLIALSSIAHWLSSNLKPRYREAVEDSLIDMSVVFASFLEQSDYPEKTSEAVMDNVKKSIFDAHVYSLSKKEVDIRVYVTDRAGKLLYHSYHPEEVGKDYSKWRDVSLTLKNQYGARTTRDDLNDSTSTVLYVAAPIKHGSDIVGVVTIAKPTKQINSFAAHARSQIAFRLLMTGLVVLLIGGIASWGLTRSILLLTTYARNIRDGKVSTLPKLPDDETGELGKAFDEMRIALEGKRYIEHYIQNLTHELKSPIAGVQGAVELLSENPPEEIRARFLANIESDVERLKSIVERLLELSSIESLDALNKVDKIPLKPLIAEVLDNFSGIAANRKIELSFFANTESSIQGDLFLVRQALSNLLDNGISFARSKVDIELRELDHFVEILVNDDGAGIPEYAKNRVFERFYSLPRPDSQRKSSGLGLCLVQEVMRLHQGSVKLVNQAGGGTTASLLFSNGKEACEITSAEF